MGYARGLLLIIFLFFISQVVSASDVLDSEADIAKDSWGRKTLGTSGDYTDDFLDRTSNFSSEFRVTVPEDQIVDPNFFNQPVDKFPKKYFSIAENNRYISASADLPLTGGLWKSFPINIQSGKTLIFEWGYVAKAKKYRLLYSVNNRSIKSYVAVYDPETNKYNYNPTNKISLTSGDVASFKIISKKDFQKDLLGAGSFGLDSIIYLADVLENRMVFQSGATVNSSLYSTSDRVLSLVNCNFTIMGSIPSCKYLEGQGLYIGTGSLTTSSPKTEDSSFISNVSENATRSSPIFYMNSTANADILVGYPYFSSKNVAAQGGYYLEIETGPPIDFLNLATSSYNIEYKICSESEDPNFGGCFDNIANFNTKTFRNDAGKSGFLWARVVGAPANQFGSLSLSVQHYVKTTRYSDFIFNSIVKPLQEALQYQSRLIYEVASSNTVLRFNISIMLTLYILLYGLYFLAGAVEIKAKDVVMRIVKIAIVVELLKPNSWEFFNDYVFNLFLGGMQYLIFSVTGNTSSTANLFGFIDPFIEMISNGSFWINWLALLFSVELHFPFAIMTLLGILFGFLGMFEVVVGYLIAVLNLTVMICMAPLFISLILFNNTRSLFKNWMNLMFSISISPTIQLLFGLILTQILMSYIYASVPPSYFGKWIDLSPHIDFLGQNLSIPFPMLYIPFFIPVIKSSNLWATVVSSSLLTLIFGLIFKNLSNFAEMFNTALTGISSGTAAGINSVKNDAKGEKV